MRTGFLSQYRAVTVSVIGAVLTSLVLVAVVNSQGLSERTTGASLLVLNFMVFTVAGVLYTGRTMLKWQIENADAYFVWERGLVIAATVATALGLVLLEDMLHAAGDLFLARVGMVMYLFGAVIVVVAETAFLSNGEWQYPQIVTYVVLAFLGQAAMGASLLQTGLVAEWVGWATIIWNMGWLLAMLIVRPRDIYYPVLHYVAPLIIGITLLAQVSVR